MSLDQIEESLEEISLHKAKKKGWADLSQSFDPNDKSTKLDAQKVHPSVVAFNPGNLRSDLGDIESLAKSIEQSGQLQPCVVVSSETYLSRFPKYEKEIGDAIYVAVAGNRRLAAIKRLAAGMSKVQHVEILVKNSIAETATTIHEANLLENIKRQNLNPVDLSDAIYGLLTNSYSSQTALAERLSMSEGWVSGIISLQRLIPEWKAHIKKHGMATSKAKELAVLSPAQQLIEYRKNLGELETIKNSVKRTPPKKSVKISGRAIQEVASDLKSLLNEEEKEALIRFLSE